MAERVQPLFRCIRLILRALTHVDDFYLEHRTLAVFTDVFMQVDEADVRNGAATYK